VAQGERVDVHRIRTLGKERRWLWRTHPKGERPELGWAHGEIPERPHE
jgi:hypothetical protein